jgi:hypothetical protein
MSCEPAPEPRRAAVLIASTRAATGAVWSS